MDNSHLPHPMVTEPSYDAIISLPVNSLQMMTENIPKRLIYVHIHMYVQKLFNVCFEVVP
jgi:hypothetical protein